MRIVQRDLLGRVRIVTASINTRRTVPWCRPTRCPIVWFESPARYQRFISAIGSPPAAARDPAFIQLIFAAALRQPPQDVDRVVDALEYELGPPSAETKVLRQRSRRGRALEQEDRTTAASIVLE